MAARSAADALVNLLSAPVLSSRSVLVPCAFIHRWAGEVGHIGSINAALSASGRIFAAILSDGAEKERGFLSPLNPIFTEN